MYVPFLVSLYFDISKCLLAAVKELSFSDHTLKLDLVAVLHFMSNRLDLVPGRYLEDAMSAFLFLKIYLRKRERQLTKNHAWMSKAPSLQTHCVYSADTITINNYEVATIQGTCMRWPPFRVPCR